MPNRTDLLNHLIKRYSLQSYLEIGLQNVSQNFDKINCEYKVSVDPDPNAKAAFCMTSDEFFNTGFYRLYVNDASETKFDLIFIDGLHTAEQVKKDFENSLKILSANGFIVIHDCNPQKEEHTIVPRPTKTGHWNGDVYKFACQLAINWLSFKTVDIDNGCGVFISNTQDYSLGDIPAWSDFDNNRKRFLNLISWEEFINR